VQKLSEIEPEAEIVYAISELAYIIGTKSQRDGNVDDALDMFGVAVAHSYIYLFSPAHQTSSGLNFAATLKSMDSLIQMSHMAWAYR